MSGTTEEKLDPKLVAITRSIEEYLDNLKPEDVSSKIAELSHFLEYFRRWSLMTQEQKNNMLDMTLSSEARERIDQAKTTKAKEDLIAMYARSAYMRRCGWEDYLHQITNKIPFVVSPEKSTGDKSTETEKLTTI